MGRCEDADAEECEGEWEEDAEENEDAEEKDVSVEVEVGERLDDALVVYAGRREERRFCVSSIRVTQDGTRSKRNGCAPGVVKNDRVAGDAGEHAYAAEPGAQEAPPRRREGAPTPPGMAIEPPNTVGKGVSDQTITAGLDDDRLG